MLESKGITMRYTGYKYNRYRGRRPNYTLLLVLVSLALVLGVFWFFLSDYMIFSADGFEFGSSLERPQENKPQENYGEPNFVIQDNRPQPEPDIPADPTPPEPQREPVYKLYPADVTRATEEGYLADCIRAARDGGYEAVALTVRTEDGVLYLPCNSRYGEGALDPNAEAIAAAVQAAAQEFPFAAVMPVCRDGKAPRMFRDQALKTNGVTWLDYNYVSWFDPTQPGAGDYAAALLDSCSQAGFSAVVLTRMSFPGRGKLELIDAPADQTATRQETVTALAAALADKAAGLQLQLSLVLESDQAENVLVTGQSVKDLQQYFTCIYLPEGDPAPLADRYDGCRFGLCADDGYLPYTSMP